MKKLALFAALLLGMAACKQEPGYKITVEIAGVPDGLKVYFADAADRNVVLDSAVTQGGRFRFSGKAEEPFEGEVSVKTPGERFSGRSFNFFVENSDIHVRTDWKNMYEHMDITGSPLELEDRAYQQSQDPVRREMDKLREQEWQVYSGLLYENKFTADCIQPGIAVAKQREALNRRLQEMDIEYIRQHPASPISLKIFARLLRSETCFTVAEMQALDNLLSPALKQTKAYKALLPRLADYGKLAKGAPFIDFKVVDMDGKEGMFSDYIQPGKYNLLEVWASWCGHCRVEIPHLKIVNEQYGDRFNIIAVSWDKDEAEWRKAMEDDNAPYLQLRAIPDGQGVDVGKCYGLHGIPFSLVIDGEGKMVTTDARGISLDLLLEELFAK